MPPEHISLLLVTLSLPVKQQSVVQFTRSLQILPVCGQNMWSFRQHNNKDAMWRACFFTVKASWCHRCCWLHPHTHSITKWPRCSNLQNRKCYFSVNVQLICCCCCRMLICDCSGYISDVVSTMARICTWQYNLRQLTRLCSTRNQVQKTDISYDNYEH